MDLTTTRIGAATVVAASGRIDSVTAKPFEERLLAVIQDAPTSLVVDFAGVDYISSAGLRVLLVAAKRSKAAQCSFALCALRPSVREVFDISGFGSIMAIHADRDGALAAAG
jgi:anti-anti-sigma factor